MCNQTGQFCKSHFIEIFKTLKTKRLLKRVLLGNVVNLQPITVQKTPSAPPTDQASMSAAVLRTTTDTSVSERSVLIGLCVGLKATGQIF